MSDDDLILMTRVARGDEAALAELYDRFSALVYRMAYQMTPTRADAEDAVQEIFVRLWRSADRYNPQRASLVTWVMIITRRYLVDQLRRRKIRPKATTFDEAWVQDQVNDTEEPDRPMLRTERQTRLLAKIAALPDLQRQVVERAYLSGKTLREISEELERPLGTIKSALSRALAGLRERMPQEEEFDDT